MLRTEPGCSYGLALLETSDFRCLLVARRGQVS